MVDLSQRSDTRKKQRAFHMTDDTHARLARAAELSNTTMSAVLDRLIWDDLHLPGDALVTRRAATEPETPKTEPEAPASAQPSGRAAQIAARKANAQEPASAQDILDNLVASGMSAAEARKDPTYLNARAFERLGRQGHFATRLDGSDQKERDPDLMGRGGEGFDL